MPPAIPSRFLPVHHSCHATIRRCIDSLLRPSLCNPQEINIFVFHKYSKTSLIQINWGDVIRIRKANYSPERQKT
jgi:hypothetical protein